MTDCNGDAAEMQPAREGSVPDVAVLLELPLVTDGYHLKFVT